MSMIYYTLIGVVLYVFADWVLDRMERARVGRFPQRMLILLAILFTLALIVFSIIEPLVGPV